MIGLIFSLFNLNIVLFGKIISLLPDFLGYLIIYYYFSKQNDNKEKKTIKGLSLVIGLYSFTTFIANLFSFNVGIMDTIINCVILVLIIVFYYQLTNYFTANRKMKTLSIAMTLLLMTSQLTSFAASILYILSTLGYLIMAIIYVYKIKKYIA